MKTWNFGVIGAGMIADFHAKALCDIPQAKLVGFCDVIPEKAKVLAEKYGCKTFKDYKAMVKSDEIDVVSIATPSGLHMEPAVAAAQAGKHVLCEKPLDVNLKRIDKMIEAHKKAGTCLGGIFPYRFIDCMKPLREAVISGRFGTITYAGAYVPWWRTDKYYEGSWRGTWKLDGGGALMNQSIHTIDMICSLMPAVESVQAYAATIAHPQIETEDTATAVLKFSGGALGVIYGTTGSFPGQSSRFEISGTKGTVIYSDESFKLWEFADKMPEDDEIRQHFCVSNVKAGASDPTNIPYKNHMRNFQAFVDALESGKDFWLDGAESRKAVELILAIYNAAKKQKLIKLNK